MCVAAAIVGGAVIGAGGSMMAASTQAGAAENAQQIAANEFNTVTQQEQPFMQAGYGALGELEYGLGIGPDKGKYPGLGYGSLNQPFTADMMKQYSPAYRFQLQQGQQGVLSQDSSGQGALSGAALKDLTSFNQNYANTAFNNAFNQYQTQVQNTYGRLAGLVNTGSSAAANLGAQGVQLAGSEAQSATNVGTAYAGGIAGASNSASQGALLGALMQGGYLGSGGGMSAADQTAAFAGGQDYAAAQGLI